MRTKYKVNRCRDCKYLSYSHDLPDRNNTSMYKCKFIKGEFILNTEDFAKCPEGYFTENRKD